MIFQYTYNKYLNLNIIINKFFKYLNGYRFANFSLIKRWKQKFITKNKGFQQLNKMLNYYETRFI